MRTRLSVLMMALGVLLLGAGWIGMGSALVDVAGVGLLVTGAFAVALSMGEPGEIPIPVEVEDRIEI